MSKRDDGCARPPGTRVCNAAVLDWGCGTRVVAVVVVAVMMVVAVVVAVHR